METKHSVIIPVYNKASTLKRAIESVLSHRKKYTEKLRSIF